MTKAILFWFLVFILLSSSGCSDKTTEPLPSVAKPVFNIGSGVYAEPQTVSITTATEEAEIRYTIDESEPTESSELYTAQVTIATDTILKARAFKEGWEPSETAVLNIVIDPDLALYSLHIFELPNSLQIETSLTITVAVMDGNEEPAPDGTIVHFSATHGFFEEEETAKTHYGVATIVWNSGTEAGEAVITVSVDEVSEDVEITILPGLPASIALTAQYQYTDDTWEPLPDAGIPSNFDLPVRIRAEVQDRYDNPVSAGFDLNFTASLGTIEPSAATDSEGVAYATFEPGTAAGMVQITAITDEPGEEGEYISVIISIKIYSEDVYTIAFAEPGDIYLDQQGTNGTEQVSLVVHLLDLEGMPVTGLHDVRYEILDPVLPGAEINGVGLSDVVTAFDGVAAADLYTATEPGRIIVKVSLVTNPAINTTKYNIYVVSPPHTISIVEPSYNTGGNMGNGIWRVDIGANVRDIFNNPVADGTEVVFSLGIDPQPPANCFIEPATVQTTAGYAGTFLYYHGSNTFDEITVIAETGDLSASQLITLPVNFPELSMEVDPDMLEFHPDSPISLEATVIAYLTDGQDNPLSNAPLKITATHGQFQYYEWFDDQNNPINDPNTPDIIITNNGEARGTISIRSWEIPPPGGDDDYTEMEVLITGFLFITNTTAQVTLTVRRYN